jgi:hypothetical protein
MQRFPTTFVILGVAAIAIVSGWFVFAGREHARFAAVDQVRRQRSEIRITYAIDHESGRLAHEEWRFANVDGRQTASYSAVDRNGTRATFDERESGYDVTFLFDKLVADGIWELQTRPFRGDRPDVHTVRIAQVTGAQSGAHTFAFSDPHYLATSAGREYHIRLDREKPVPDLLTLDSTSSADPRYQKIVNDVESYGSPRFRETIVKARQRLLRS